MAPRRWRTAAALGVGLFLAQMPLYGGYLTDDTFIYARFARNLARTGQLVFNRGEPVDAVTSPLWAGAGAVGVVLGADAFWTLKILGMLCGLVAVTLFARTAGRLLPRPWDLLAVGMLATDPWFVRWSASGMETSLAALAVILILDSGLRPHGRVAAARLGATAGLAPLIRPELALLSALVAVAALSDRRIRRVRGFWLGLALPPLLWCAYAVPTYGVPWPETIQAKSTPLGLRPARLWANLKVLASLFAVAGALPAVAVLAGLRGWRRRIRAMGEGSALVAVAWLWIFLLPTLYLLRDVQVVSRYLEVVFPVVLLLGSTVLATSRWAGRLRVAAAAQIVLSLALTVGWVSPSTRAFSRTLQAGLGDIAQWLVDNTRPDDAVAVYDIGLVGYRSDRPILDLGGLVQPRINDLRNHVDDEDIVRQGLFLRFGHPRYLIHRAAVADALADASLAGFRAVPILDRTVANLGLSRSAPVVYTLYRLEPKGS